MNFRKLEFGDLHFLTNVRNKYAKLYLHDSRIFTLKESQDWYINTSPKFYIIEKDSEKIGYVRLSNYSSINKNIYIGIDIDDKFTGKGYGYKAYQMFIRFIFKTYELNKITLEVLHTNKQAIALYYKLGFTYEGEKREEVIKNGKFVNSIIMSILKSEYKKMNYYNHE